MLQTVVWPPGTPHPWWKEISAWARGEIIQWRYRSPEATEADWRDCDPLPTRPNFDRKDIEYRYTGRIRT